MRIRKKIFDPIPIENEEGIDWSVDEVPENRGSGRHWLSNDYIVASLSKEQIQTQIKYHQRRIKVLEEIIQSGEYGRELRKFREATYEDLPRVSRQLHKKDSKEFLKLKQMILDGKLTPLMIKELLKCISK